MDSGCLFAQWTLRPTTAETMATLFTIVLSASSWVGTWEVPNKHFLNEYVIESVIYCVSCGSKVQNVATAHLVYNNYCFCLI